MTANDSAWSSVRVFWAEAFRIERLNMGLPSHPPRKGGNWGCVNGQRGGD